MTPIDYRIGYRVKVDPKDCITARCRWSNIDWGTLFEELLWSEEHPTNYFKGVISEVKTHKFFGLIQLDEPIFTVTLDIKKNGPYTIETKYPKLIIKSSELMAMHYMYLLNDEFKKETNNVANSG